MFPENVYFLRRLSIPQVSRCPAGVDRGCSRSFQALAAILDTVTIRLDVTLVSMPDKMNLGYYVKLLYCEFQKYEVMTMSVVVVSQKNKTQILVIKQQDTSLNALR